MADASTPDEEAAERESDYRRASQAHLDKAKGAEADEEAAKRAELALASGIGKADKKGEKLAKKLAKKPLARAGSSTGSIDGKERGESKQRVRIDTEEGKGSILRASEGIRQGEVILIDEPLLTCPNGPITEEPRWQDFLKEVSQVLGGEASIKSFHALGQERGLEDYELLGPLKHFTLSEGDQERLLSLYDPDMEDVSVQERYFYLCPDKEETYLPDEALLEVGVPDPPLFKRALRILDSNSMAAGEQQEYLVLPSTLSRLSHSCCPNSARSGHPTPESMTQCLRAIRDIGEGEEITISYLSDTELMECTYLRRDFLRRTKFFTCLCERCERKPDIARAFNCPYCACPCGISGGDQGEHFPCVSCANACADLKEGRSRLECAQALDADSWEAFEANEAKMYENCIRAEQAGPQNLQRRPIEHLLQMTEAARLGWRHFLRGRCSAIAFERALAEGLIEEALRHLEARIAVDEALREEPNARHAWDIEFKADLLQRGGHTKDEKGRLQATRLYQRAQSELRMLFGSQHHYVREVMQKKAYLLDA